MMTVFLERLFSFSERCFFEKIIENFFFFFSKTSRYVIFHVEFKYVDDSLATIDAFSQK
jgi:hypothetical protein